MTDKKPKIPISVVDGYAKTRFGFPLLTESGEYLQEYHGRIFEYFYEQGKQAQYVETINLFNKLRNGRFQFNDEVKMVIDMLKDEITRMR